MQNIPLVLKRVECYDRRIFDNLVYEMDTLMRFRGHPNVLSLFSYWTEPADRPYRYKTLVQLYEEATMGDMLNSVVLSSTRPSQRIILKWIIDLTKALRSFHNSQIVHGGVKAKNIFLSADNQAMLGPLGKMKTD